MSAANRPRASRRNCSPTVAADASPAPWPSPPRSPVETITEAGCRQSDATAARGEAEDLAPRLVMLSPLSLLALGPGLAPSAVHSLPAQGLPPHPAGRPSGP